MALAQLCKNTLACLCEQPNISIANGKNWLVGCWSWWFFFLVWATLEVTSLWIVQDQGNKSDYVSTMRMLIKVQISYLVNTMSIHRREELNMVERSACNYFRSMWKLISSTMMIKCHKLYHGFKCVHCHEHNKRSEYP